jgi:prophage maintenance system killer protein
MRGFTGPRGVRALSWTGYDAHPFIDGNKRTGTAQFGTYLRIHGIRFTPDSEEFLQPMPGVAEGSIG